ncbi:MAG TPA: hypothetical protein DCQ36_08240, partial [Actinobacteria bacterium]|nr:hypothetical protein [Actinomycetota bacterium]
EEKGLGGQGDGEHEGAAQEEAAHDPRLEEEKSFGEKVGDNAKGEAYEQEADKLVDAGAGKAAAFFAGPKVTPKADARVVHPQIGPAPGPAPAPGPTPGPTPGPGPNQHVPWWKRLWRAVKRGARAVGRGAVRAAGAVKRGFSAAGRRIRSWFS